MSRDSTASAGLDGSRPLLLFFHDSRSGRSRRVEGFLAQVLQRRANHHTFQLRQLDYEHHRELARRLGVHEPPALIVVHDKKVQARLDQPHGCTPIRDTLAPWLR
jgi:hypothetical protein